MKVADEFEQQVDDAAKLDGTLLEEVGIWVSVHIRFSRKLGFCLFPFYSSWPIQQVKMFGSITSNDGRWIKQN